MKNHVWRPLWLTLALVVLVLAARHFMVPADFGVHGRNFTYGFHRLGNIQEWQEFQVKYRGMASCAECHPDNAATHAASKHGIVQCENCHGPAIDHPEDPETLVIDRRRELCLRCHAGLPYPANPRSAIPGIPADHHPGQACADCHDPHQPDL